MGTLAGGILAPKATPVEAWLAPKAPLLLSLIPGWVLKNEMPLQQMSFRLKPLMQKIKNKKV